MDFIKAIEVMDDDVYVQFYNNIGKSYKNIKEFDNSVSRALAYAEALWFCYNLD